MNQYYILEIQQYDNGEYGHIVHFAYDEDAVKARLKAESKYHEVLAPRPNSVPSLIGTNNNGSNVQIKFWTH